MNELKYSNPVITKPMAKINKLLLAFAMGLLFIAFPSKASDICSPGINEEVNDSTSLLASGERESIFQNKTRSLAFSHFTWGAEIGSSIDMTSNDMSTIDADVLLGFKNSFVKLAGVGVGIHRSIHSGNNYIPLYGVIRTSFRKKPSLCFMNIQAGCSFNTIADSGSFANFISALGIGFNLKQTRMIKSYLLVSAGYSHLCDTHKEMLNVNTHHILTASIALGVNF